MNLSCEKVAEYLRLYLLLVATTYFSLYLHLVAVGSPLVTDSDTWLSNYNLLVDHYPYNIRLLQTYTMRLLHALTGWSFQFSFYFVQYLLAFLLGLSFYKFLKKLTFSSSWSLFGTGLLMLALPIAAAHFEPVHTRDDMWLYLFSVLAFSALLDKKWIHTALYFTLGCFAREQMLLFYPILLVTAWIDRNEINRKFMIPALLIPLVIYGAFYLFNYEPSDPKRWTLFYYNFADSAHAADSTISVWNAFGLIWLPAFIGATMAWKKRTERNWRICLFGAAMVVPMTMFLGIFFTLVRETRILFPPFVFMIPLAVLAIREYWQQITISRRLLFWTLAFVATAVAILFGLMLAQLFWPSFDYISGSQFRRDFAGVNIGLAFLFLILIFSVKRSKNKSEE